MKPRSSLLSCWRSFHVKNHSNQIWVPYTYYSRPLSHLYIFPLSQRIQYSQPGSSVTAAEGWKLQTPWLQSKGREATPAAGRGEEASSIRLFWSTGVCRLVWARRRSQAPCGLGSCCTGPWENRPEFSGLWGTAAINTGTNLNNSDRTHAFTLLAKPSEQL